MTDLPKITSWVKHSEDGLFEISVLLGEDLYIYFCPYTFHLDKILRHKRKAGFKILNYLKEIAVSYEKRQA